MAKKNIKKLEKLDKPIPIKTTKKPIAKYIGDTEVYFPHFNKIINKGDLVPEMPIEEAMARRDFTIINKEE